MTTKKTMVGGFLAAILAFTLALAFTACKDKDGDEDDYNYGPAPQSAAYTSQDSDGNFYTLVITEKIDQSARYTAKDGDYFTFTVELFNNDKYSVALAYSGTIESAADSGTEIVIGVTVNGKPLTITLKGAVMTVISGTIVLDNKEEKAITGPLTPANTPEDWPAAKRWSTWKADDSTATVDYSVANDGVCTVTVGGTAMTAMPGWDYVWKVNSAYAYTAAAGKTYTYTFEAWTEGADRTMTVQWYNDWVNNDIHNTGFENEKPTFKITSEQHKTYTLKAIEYVNKPIPKSGVQQLEFQCANQLGRFYVKIISITAEEYKPAGQLTITNFRGTPSLRTDVWSTGFADFSVNGNQVTVVFDDGFDVPSGNSMTVSVFNAEVVEVISEYWRKLEKTSTLFTGNVTAAAQKLWICQWGRGAESWYQAFYTNKVPITFTNGSATINFEQQMGECRLEGDWVNP